MHELKLERTPFMPLTSVASWAAVKTRAVSLLWSLGLKSWAVERAPAQLAPGTGRISASIYFS
jgi:hypothetical protein